MPPKPDAFVIKTEVRDLEAAAFTFAAQKTMYVGKLIAAGDTLFIFASENEGGRGLVARGTVASVEPMAKRSGPERQTPRVSVTVERLKRAATRLGRSELKSFRAWNDGQPQTELNFKLYRQATGKIVGITPQTVTFLQEFFSGKQPKRQCA
jgi:hypothetical protein